jgi:hypothetical protein
MSEAVLGIDQSPTGLGVCVIPVNWDMDFRNVYAARFDGGKLTKDACAHDRIARMSSLAIRVCDFARQWRVTHGWLESSLSMGAFSIVPQAKLAGALEVKILDIMGLALETAHISTVRKYLLGKLPRSDAKEIVREVVWSLDGARKALLTGDEVDAFVIANWALTELGYAGFCGSVVKEVA